MRSPCAEFDFDFKLGSLHFLTCKYPLRKVCSHHFSDLTYGSNSRTDLVLANQSTVERNNKIFCLVSHDWNKYDLTGVYEVWHWQTDWRILVRYRSPRNAMTWRTFTVHHFLSLCTLFNSVFLGVPLVDVLEFSNRFPK